MKFITKSWIQTQFNNFAEKIASVFAKKSDIPTKLSQLNNDRGFINSINSLYNDGYIPRGFGVLNKVWGTDGSGNPGWRDYTPINSLSATIPGTSLDAVQGKILADRISYTEDLVDAIYQSEGIISDLVTEDVEYDLYYSDRDSEQYPAPAELGNNYKVIKIPYDSKITDYFSYRVTSTDVKGPPSPYNTWIFIGMDDNYAWFLTNTDSYGVTLYVRYLRLETTKGSKLTDLEIYDFEIENPFANDVTYKVRENVWYPQNKIYKFGRVCWITLGVDTTNVTIPNRVLKVAELPDKFAPLSIISAGDPAGYSTGFYPGSNYIYISDRNTEKYPNWSDITIAEEFVRFNFVYISKI